MPEFEVAAGAKVESFSMVVTRANGEVVDLGVVGRNFDDPIRQWWWDHVGKVRAERRIRQFNESNRPKE